MEKLYHKGVMRTKCSDCQFVCITQTDYYRILHQGEENIKRHEDKNGKVVLVTEQRTVNTADGVCKGYVVIRVSIEKFSGHVQKIFFIPKLSYIFCPPFFNAVLTFLGNRRRITKAVSRRKFAY